MDQGGELWRSNRSWGIAVAAGYAMEPTGFDAASKNGKVEQPNGTFGAMVSCLLYSTGLSAICWSAALVHAVYLNIRLYHKVLRQTPYEACTDEKPMLAHLRTFGALVTARKPGKRTVKADHHTSHGVLLGYGATAKHVRYFDQTTNREKLSTHHISDEAHYGKTLHPPGPQIIIYMDMSSKICARTLLLCHHCRDIRYALSTSQ
jgi:GH24 family phage-related lysozyme (muramidase)